MAEFRQVHTRIWHDDWFVELSPNDKLIFIYLFTNENSNLAGLYKLSMRHAQLETGLTIDYILKAMGNFETADKVVYRDGYVWVKNLRKYNASRSPKTSIAIASILEAIPDCEIKTLYMAYYKDNIPYRYGIDTPSTKQNKTKQSSADDTLSHTDYDSLAECFETSTGCPIVPTEENVNTINGWVRDGITEAEIKDAVAYYSGNGRTARSPAQIDKSVRTAYAKRVQSGVKSQVVIDPREYAEEVW